MRFEGLNGEPVLLDPAALWPLPLVFRVQGPDRARHVSGRLSPGRVLLLAPESWQVHGVDSATLLGKPECTSLEGVLAYSYLLDGTSAAIVVTDSIGQAHRLSTSQPRLKLTGPVVEDLHPYQGPLFAPSAPAVELTEMSNDPGESDSITTLVVGEEGPVEGPRRQKFEIDVSRTRTVDLNRLLGRRSGWYFVRAYNSALALVDSLDFRYFAGDVRQVPRSRKLHHPEAVGDGLRVSVELPGSARLVPDDSGARTCRVEERQGAEAEAGPFRCLGSTKRFIVSLPPDPNTDRTRWMIHQGEGARVALVVRAARLWWAVGSDSEQPPAWGARVLDLRLSSLRPTSEVVLWLRCDGSLLPEVDVRTNCTEALAYRVPADGRLPIPLRDFSEAWRQVQTGQGRGAVVKLVLRGAGLPDEVLLATFRPSHICRICGAEFQGQEGALNHLGVHVEEEVQELSDEETRTHLERSAVSCLYECLYCGYWVPNRVPESNLRNPTTLLQHHIQFECDKAPVEDGRKQIQFRVVWGARDMRTRPGLRAFRCRACNEVLVAKDSSVLSNHLAENHFSRLMTLS